MVDFINSNFIAEAPRNIYDPEIGIESALNDDGSLSEIENYVPITTALTFLNSCMGKNTLIEGGSGLGKTKLAGVVGSILYQIPNELFEMKRVAGTPGATVNEIYATHDIAELNKGKDVAFLYLPFHFPLLVIDELNRFSELEQNRIREGVASDVWSYAGHSWKIPGQVVISAVNPDSYGGTFRLNENLLDNYSIVLEPPLFDPLTHEEVVLNSEENIRKFLSLEECLDDIIPYYAKNKNDPELIANKIKEIQEMTAEKFKKEGIPFVFNGDIGKIREEISSVKLNSNAKLFQYALLSESTYSNSFGRLRLEDPPSDDSHDKKYLAGSLIEGLGGRFMKDWIDTAKMISWYMNKKEVGIEELKSAFIYSAPRRIKPNEELFQNVMNNPRNLPISFKVAKEVVDIAYNNYGDYSDPKNPSFNKVMQAIEILQGKSEGMITADAIRILKSTDHPLAKSVLKYVTLHKLKELKGGR